MTLTPEQQTTVASWVAAGDTLSTVQKKLREQLNVSLTYMDVRFLVDDLNLSLKDPVVKAPAPSVVSPAPVSAPHGDPSDDLTQPPFSGQEELPPDGPSNLRIEVDVKTLNPNAIASGSVTFSDGVTGKWIVDHQGRPGFTSVSKPNYRPSPADAQAFMTKLGAELQKKGF